MTEGWQRNVRQTNLFALHFSAFQTRLVNNRKQNPLTLAPSEERPGRPHWLNRTVLAIGLASLFSDWSPEIATAVIPAFLATMGALLTLRVQPPAAR